MKDDNLETHVAVQNTADDRLYDPGDLSYANSFPDFWRRNFIKTIELLTARPYLLYKMRKWEKNQNKPDDFWESVLEEMNIKLQLTKEGMARIPKTGPLVVVSNHPQGLVDGIMMARLLSQVRDDYQILTRALLVGVEKVEKYLLPVSFPHEENAIKNNVNMRKKAISSLRDGHCIALFPAGTVATSKTFFGPITEPSWMPFTAKMILQTGAQVVPIYYDGSNTRMFQIANCISPLFRQSLLLYEIRAGFNKVQRPEIGEPIDPAKIAEFQKDTPGLMEFLRAETLKLKRPS